MKPAREPLSCSAWPSVAGRRWWRDALDSGPWFPVCDSLPASMLCTWASPVSCSVTRSCPVISDPVGCGTPGLPVFHHPLDFTQTHLHRVGDAIEPSSSVVPFSSHLQSFSASGSFQMSQFFASGGQSIGASASASVLPMNIQNRFPLGWTGWISLQSEELSPTPQFMQSYWAVFIQSLFKEEI